MSVHIFGIRHHGPGCARSLRAALAALAPDIVLVEGPPEGEAVLPLIGAAGMEAPVALLLYAPEAPQRAVYYPFAVFSPEWQALTYARERGIPARFMDLPQAAQLAALAHESPEDAPEPEPDVEGREAAADTVPASLPGAKPAPAGGDDQPESTRSALRDDPIGLLAEAAGYADHELWWEQQIEQRVDATDLFEGIMEAMAALRADAGAPTGEEGKREAHMRQTIRAAESEGHTRIAVVCGAWHAPALALPARATISRPAPRAMPRCWRACRVRRSPRRGFPGPTRGSPTAPAMARASPRPAGTRTCGRRRTARACAGWRMWRGCCASKTWMPPPPA